MNNLIPITANNQILPEYRDTPIGLLLEYHNLGRNEDKFDVPQLLIGMCMDHRKRLRIPLNFAFIIRTGGANLRYSEFKISFAISVGGVKHFALIVHNDCGMVNLSSKKEIFINGLIENAGWERSAAEDHFFKLAPMFEIVNETDFVLTEVRRLRLRYPKVCIAPMLYKVEDDRLYLIGDS